MNILLSTKVPIGIIDAEFPASLDETIESIKSAVGNKPAHIVDYCAWPDDFDTIKKKLSDSNIEIDDHHNAFAKQGYLSATSSILHRYKSGELIPKDRLVLTCRPNFDCDLLLSTYASLNPNVNIDLLEKSSIFADSTMFGGNVFDEKFKLETDEQILSFAISQRIYEETVNNFPKEYSFLKGFPANKPGIAQGVLIGFENIMQELSSNLLIDNVKLAKAEQYLQRLRIANSNARKIGVELIPDVMTYLDLRERTLDTSSPMPFWYAEGNAGFTRNSKGVASPLVLRESKAGYVFASADTRTQNGEKIDLDLTKVVKPLSDMSGKPWFGKDTVLFGQRTENATPENIAKIVQEIYKI